jgi:hypothetical protein
MAAAKLHALGDVWKLMPDCGALQENIASAAPRRLQHNDQIPLL